MEFEKGQSGNPNGRPKGSRNKFGERFHRDYMDAWESYSAKALEWVAVTSPVDFLRIGVQLLPKVIELDEVIDGPPATEPWSETERWIKGLLEGRGAAESGEDEAAH